MSLMHPDAFELNVIRAERDKLREQVAAQAAVIEKLREALLVSHDLSTSTITRLLNTIPTDSTQILDEVRRAEREKCAKVVEEGTALTAFQSKDCYSYAYNRAAAIRAME